MKALTRLSFPSPPPRCGWPIFNDPNPPPNHLSFTSASASFAAAAAATASSLSASAYPSLEKAPVVVVGSANADIYVEIDRLPCEGETVAARTGQTLAGGKGANQACCGARLAHPTYFVGQVGDDAHGRLIESALNSGNVRLDRLSRVAGAPTGHAIVMLQSDGQKQL